MGYAGFEVLIDSPSRAVRSHPCHCSGCAVIPTPTTVTLSLDFNCFPALPPQGPAWAAQAGDKRRVRYTHIYECVTTHSST
jgi:hypothetical protein